MSRRSDVVTRHYLISCLVILLPTLTLSQETLLTVEATEELKQRISDHVILVNVTVKPGPLEDESFVVRRYGQAARARVAGRVRVVTSQTLISNAKTLDLSLLDGTSLGSAIVTEILDQEGLAELRCDRCRRELRASLAPQDACQKDRILFYIMPAGDSSVLSHTVVLGEAVPSLERHLLVAGQLVEGMPLFTAKAEIAAIVVRPLPGTDRSLAVNLCRPLPNDGAQQQE